jgi:ribosomal protein L16 Arg81 hydroxylase
MHATAFDFPRVLQPLTPEVFFQEYWEQRPLLLSRDKPGYFSSLFSLPELEDVLWSTRPGWGGVQLANHQRGEGWIDYTTQPPSLERLARAYAQGDTLVLNDMQLRSRSIAALCRSFETAFTFVVNVNLYLTPRGAQGLSPHFDTQDAFILQIEGSKHWRLYPACVELPLDEMAGPLPEGACREPLMTAHLRAGDVLYMPRGVVHEALTSEEPSMHLTVGLGVLSWKTLLDEAVQLASEQGVDFRRALPPGCLTREEALPHLRAGLEALLAKLPSQVHAEQAVERLTQRYLRQVQPLPDEDLQQVAQAREPGVDTRVRKREGLLCRVRQMGNSIRLEFPGGSVEGPKPIEPALRFVSEAREFTINELPGGLSERSKLVLARRLIAEGVLHVLPA